MSKFYLLLTFLLPLCGICAESDLYNRWKTTDFCESTCQQSYPQTSFLDSKHFSCCSQGCRFFNLVHLVEDRDSIDLNATKIACQSSCSESYINKKERFACNGGCLSMAKKKQVESLVAQIGWSVYLEGSTNILLLQPMDFEPDDVLTDPGLRIQLEQHFGLDGSEMRLPETRVRTLPVEQRGVQAAPRAWLDCAARRTGLPRSALAVVALAAILLAAWLCLAPDRQTVEYVHVVRDNAHEFPEFPPKYSYRLDEV